MWIGYDYRTVGLCKWNMMATHLLPPLSSKTVLFGLNDFFSTPDKSCEKPNVNTIFKYWI